MPDRPDIVLVMTDQQRHDQVGYAADGAVRTPHLDRLAASGVTFTDAYSASTTCVPSRTALMTGLLDHRAEHVRRYALAPGSFTVAHALRAVGYQTALIGKMHFDPIRSEHGFDHLRTCEHLDAYTRDPHETGVLDHYHDWLRGRGLADWRDEPGPGLGGTYTLDPRTHPTSWVRDETIAFLAQRDPSRPLFLVVSFPHPHPPTNPPEPYASMYDPAACVIDPDGAEVNQHLPRQFRDATAQADQPARRVDPTRLDQHRRVLALTYGLITQIDDAVGTLLEHLDLRDALLFFTADHGDYAGHRGLVRKVPWIPFDDLAKVPCFAAGGRVAGGRVERALVQSFDVATTALSLAGADVDLAELDGADLSAPLADPSVPFDGERVVYSALTMGWPMARCGAHKYIRHPGWGEEVLFDVVRDPEERWNVLGLDADRTITGALADAVDRQLAAGPARLPSFLPT